MDPLRLFGPATARWFTDTFAGPTRAQREAWPRIAAGEHTLVLAPTGSGKTLAAFLWALDRLTRLPAEAPEGVRVVYVSPLKALAHDIERNLRVPLAAIEATAELLGESLRPTGAMVRTGDTSSTDRRRQAKHPADILITTPESLYLLLGSAARENLRRVETVIVDEVHVLADRKRGVHLALSLERLAELAEADPQRIGLSATQRPLEEVARFLGGDRAVACIDAAEPPALDLRIEVPVPDMDAPAAHTDNDDAEARKSIWPAVYPRLLELILEHRATIVFCNSRLLSERLCHHLNDLAAGRGVEGPLVRAHHGSISRAQRVEVEEALKEGRLRGIVATSSLELGIDMGFVDLVLQVESPGSAARGLQRIGRAGHRVGEVSRGRVFPKYKGDLLECAVVSREMLAGRIERTRVPRRCLDVLAQQIVAYCSLEDHSVAEIERWARRCYSYADLSRELLVEVLELLAGRYPAHELAELRPRLVWDREADRLRSRRDARTISLVNGGTIPDRGLYPLHRGDGGPRIGELDEEMVHETRPGHVIVLGATSWRVREITNDRVVVEPAPGQPGRLPFWRGEGPGRSVELGRAVGAFTRGLAELPPGGVEPWLLAHTPLDRYAARNLAAYLAEEEALVGALPSDRTLIVERFRDELGDWRICILSPLGARVHAPWALALEHTLRSQLGDTLEGQVLWGDDGLLLRLPDMEALPPTEQLLPDPDEIEELVVSALAGSALFAGRFRDNAARALLLPRRRPGQRAPLWAQRKRASSLLAVAQRHPTFPILLETYREVLEEVFDVPALTELLRGVQRREVDVQDVETPFASPFARSLVFAFVHHGVYEGDMPAAERKAHALSLDLGLLRELLGEEALSDLLDEEVVEAVEGELQALAGGRRARGPDQVHDLLRRLGDLTLAELRERCEGPTDEWLAGLAHRVTWVDVAGERRAAAVEDASRLRDALGIELPEGLPAAWLDPVDAPLEGLLVRWARAHGPFTAGRLADRYGLPEAQARLLLEALEGRGQIVRAGGRGGTPRWCDPDVLHRIRRRTLARLRAEVEPVDGATLARFLAGWQGVDGRPRGRGQLRTALAQLEGLALPWSEWVGRILPARVPDFSLTQLDELGAAGELVWVGRGALGRTDGRVALYRRERAALLLAPPPEWDPPTARHAAVVEHLERRGASFTVELRRAAGEPSQEDLMDVLRDLVWTGRVTNDTLAPLSGLTAPRRAGRTDRRAVGGRWSLVSDLLGAPPPPTERAHALAELLLDRWGVVARASLADEEVEGGFAGLYPLLRALEEAGRVRRGWFVDGLSGAQFAAPGAVDRLRRSRGGAAGGPSVLAAVDPANPYGALLPWPAGVDGVQRAAGATVVLVAGVPALHLGRGAHRLTTLTDDETLLEAALPGLAQAASARRRRSLTLRTVNGEPARTSPLAPLLARSGFVRDYKGLTLRAT